MDYSIHDALQAGFDKVIFIIRRDIEEDFKTYRRRIENGAGEYAYQELGFPAGMRCPREQKPWGQARRFSPSRGWWMAPSW